MKKSKKYALMITLEVILGTSVGYFGGQLFDYISEQISINNEKKKFEGIDDIMLKSKDDRILTLEKYKNPISVTISNFNEKEKQDVIDAVNRLDEISDTLNYTIIENENYNLTANINISKGAVENEDAVGITEYHYNGNYKITYPINIIINEKDFIDTDTLPDFLRPSVEKLYEKKLGRVVKHELMHTLGFADLRSEEHKDQTLMWYNIEGYNEIYDYTERDIANIKKLYDNILVDVHYPKHMQYVYIDSSTKEQSTEENELLQ